MSSNAQHIPETCGVEEAAAILNLSESALKRRARAGIVPGARIARRWVFIRADLLALVRQNYRTPCSISAQTLRTGTSYFESTASESASQLAQRIARKRKLSRPKLEIVPGGKPD